MFMSRSCVYGSASIYIWLQIGVCGLPGLSLQNKPAKWAVALFVCLRKKFQLGASSINESAARYVLSRVLLDNAVLGLLEFPLRFLKTRSLCLHKFGVHGIHLVKLDELRPSSARRTTKKSVKMKHRTKKTQAMCGAVIDNYRKKAKMKPGCACLKREQDMWLYLTKNVGRSRR